MSCIEIIRDSLLNRAFHAFWICNNKIYLHGGVEKYNSNEDPFGDVVEIDVSSKKIRALPCKNHGPNRSHHKCALIEDKWACMVGGWDGKQRTTDVHALNMETCEWSTLCVDDACDPPAGLSSHTCTKVGSNEFIITGREGGVRMQRRYGSVYNLTIDVHNGMYHYKEMPIHISSRSGHSACMLEKGAGSKSSSKLSLFVFGGRDTDSGEIIGNWSKTKVDHLKELESRLQLHIDAVSLNKNQTQQGKDKLSFMDSKPRSLRHHAVISSGKFCLIHGGEVFGKARDTISGEIFIHNNTGLKWWCLDSISKSLLESKKSLLKRMGHTICFMNDHIYIISGVGGDGKNTQGSVVALAI